MRRLVSIGVVSVSLFASALFASSHSTSTHIAGCGGEGGGVCALSIVKHIEL